MPEELTFEGLATRVAALDQKMADYVLLASKKAETELDDDKQEEASFKKAMKENDNDYKSATEEMDKVKDAFKRASEETNPDKKKEAMKKAMEEKKDYDQKTSKKAETEPKDEKKDARTASLENKFANPIKEKILEATQIFDPTNLEKVKKELSAASLEDVENKYATIKPFIAALGGINVEASHVTPSLVPFQASSVIGKSTDFRTASTNTVDWGKVSTKEIQEMYK